MSVRMRVSVGDDGAEPSCEDGIRRVKVAGLAEIRPGPASVRQFGGFGARSGVHTRHMNGPSSPFYPPRARWYSRWLGRLECLFPSLQPRVVFAGPQFGWKGWLAGAVVPGAGFWLIGRPVLARWCFLGHLFLVTLGIAAAGFPLGAGALAFAAGIHAAGLVCLVHRAAVDRTRLLRIGSLLAPLLVYFQACLLVGEHLFLPLDVGGQVIVVSRLTVPEDVRIGDFVACQLAERRVHGFSMGSSI